MAAMPCSLGWKDQAVVCRIGWKPNTHGSVEPSAWSMLSSEAARSSAPVAWAAIR